MHLFLQSLDVTYTDIFNKFPDEAVPGAVWLHGAIGPVIRLMQGELKVHGLVDPVDEVDAVAVVVRLVGGVVVEVLYRLLWVIGQTFGTKHKRWLLKNNE